MSRASSSDKKVSPFLLSTKKEWINAAKLELDGANPLEKLKQRVDEIEVMPYYDSSDLTSADFQLPISQNEFLGPQTWFNLPWIPVNDAKEANEHALQLLNSGADGILFELKGAVDPNILLKKIEIPYCSTVFLADRGQEDFFYAFAALVKERKYTASTLAGTLFWKSPPTNPQKLIEQFKDWSQFHSLGIIEEEVISPTHEMATILAKTVKQLDQLTGSVEKINQALNAVAFSVSIGTDLFLEIAKLKALRFLWLQIAKAYDPNYISPIFIHATVKAMKSQDYQPHGNMIQGTTASLSAILGGCDALTVQPVGNPVSITTRVARNVSSILREESHMGKVSDPTAGSYYIEKLTDQLASIAWEKFQHLVK